MRNFTSSALASVLLLIGANPIKADTTYIFNTTSNGYSTRTVEIFQGTTNADGSSVDFSKISTLSNANNFNDNSFWHDASSNKLYFFDDTNDKVHAYDITNDTWNNNVSFTSDTLDDDGTNYTHFFKDTSNLITKNANGEIHIGENSWITKEENGRQKVWAKDANGNSIPIDYTNGTKLLINGRDVDQAIDNVGALSAALTGLPTVPQDSPLACGVGAGAHSGSNALSGGCASKINERLSFNAAASFIPANQEYQGTDNSWSGRAGFVFKLGKINNPTLISMKEKKALQTKVDDLAFSNEAMKKANQELQMKVSKFNSEKAELISRLEQLEQIALGLTKSTDLESIVP